MCRQHRTLNKSKPLTSNQCVSVLITDFYISVSWYDATRYHIIHLLLELKPEKNTHKVHFTALNDVKKYMCETGDVMSEHSVCSRINAHYRMLNILILFLCVEKNVDTANI